MTSPYATSAYQMSPEDRAALERMYENAGRLQLREIEERYGLGRAQLDQAWKIAGLESGDRRYGIETQREIALAQIAQAREEMLRIGIPRVEIERWIAEKNYEIADRELGFKREQWEDQLGLQRGALTGMYEGDPTLDYRKLMMDQEELARRYGLDVGRETGYLDGQTTIERERMMGDLGLRR